VQSFAAEVVSSKDPVPDLSMWRPLAGSLLEALPTLKCHNLHALTIVIITKYIYIFYGGPLVVEAPGNCPVCPPPLNPAVKRSETLIILSAFRETDEIGFVRTQ